MDLLTSGDIARQVNADRDAVSYAIRKLGAEPDGRAGNVRLFAGSTAEEVQAYLTQRKPRKALKS